jgi:hypothetical protein
MVITVKHFSNSRVGHINKILENFQRKQQSSAAGAHQPLHAIFYIEQMSACC